MLKLRYASLLIILLFQCPGFSQATTEIKIMTYNTSDDGIDWRSNPPTTRLTQLHNVITSVGTDGPDIIVAIEIGNNNTGVFLNDVLGSSYSKGTFIPNTHYNGPNSNCLYYKTSKFLNPNFSNVVIQTFDADGTTQYRDFNKFEITQNGGETIVIYAVHLKPGSISNSGADRTAEIQYLLKYIKDNSPSSTSENFIVLGDFNTNRSSEDAYKNLLYYPDGGLNGYFYDPKQSDPPSHFGNWDDSNMNGFWDTSLSYDSPSPTERYDMILMSGNVWNVGGGIHYSGTYTVVGNPIQNSDAESASNHLPVYATFDFTNNPQPVELVSFTGAANRSQVDLHWETATEVNNYGFEVERSVDNIDWTTLSFIEGNGNSNSPKYYEFIDNDITKPGIYNYRLKQIDNNGSYEYSNIIDINVSIPNKYYLSQNYPNPFNPETKIDFSIPQKQLVTLRVYNTLGEQVAELLNEVQDAGSYSVIFDGSKLPSGIYIYRLGTQNFVINNKMSLLK